MDLRQVLPLCGLFGRKRPNGVRILSFSETFRRRRRSHACGGDTWSGITKLANG